MTISTLPDPKQETIKATPFQDGMAAYQRSDYATAIELWRPIAEEGDVAAQINLGYLYGRGYGVLQDHAEALKWFRLAADQESAYAQCALGRIYQFGRGVAENYVEAAKWYLLAAGQGNTDAQNNLGNFYEGGEGGLPKDEREAARQYKLASDGGNAAAQYNLGRCYDKGLGGLQRDDCEAARLYKLAADQSYAQAQLNLGVFHAQGRGSLPQDDVTALFWYRKAADQGNAWAQAQLGLFYEKGRGGLPRDDCEATHLYRLAADQENAWAQNQLGFFYEKGRGGLPKDDREASRLYKLAADQGDAVAQVNLGFFYSEGRGGLTKDECEAARLYKLAADQGNAVAQCNLAWFHEHGLGGLPKDDREAARLYKLAADQGNAWAKTKLRNPSSQNNQTLANNLLTGLDNLIKWASCPHGVLAGKYKNRCEKCVRERIEIEENRRRQHELWERKRRINAAADTLREKERERLAKSIVPRIQELRLLTPPRFEDEVAQMFERLGYEVKQTPYIKDGGRDAILTKDGQKYLVECKRYAEGGLSGRRDLQIFHSAMTTDGAISGFFVTAGRFTQDAIKFAPTVRIELIDQDGLVRMMFDSKPAAADEDTYCSMCRQCEDLVSHRLRVPQSIRCRNGHDVEPSLDISSVLSASRRRAHFNIG
jgi:TPR repeat protein/restriction endonuclease Mrr